MARRVVQEASPGSPASAVASKLRQLVRTADEAAKLAAGAEAALLVNDDAEASAANAPVVIRDWLHAFWAAMYELDDTLDDYNDSVTRHQQPAEEARRSVRQWFRSSQTGVHDAEYKRLKTAVEKLDKKMHGLLQQGSRIGLHQPSLEKQSWNPEFTGDPTPYYDATGDIEQQVLKLIAMLTHRNSSSVLENDGRSNHVVAIVGCGGTGKTTLAGKVIESQCIRCAFSMALWVRGSKDFTDIGLLSAIASAAGIKAGEGGSREKNEEMLASVLQGKRILLVIDDVWSHQIHENYLNNCLSVQHGSRILMTACDESVMEHVNPSQVHKLKEFPFPDCLSLLSSSACLDVEQSATIRQTGIILIQKCRRVPLSIKVIGGVLRTKESTYEEWKKVSEWQGWYHSLSGTPESMKEVARPICMAYNDLPSHLKRCFLYCLHLPEGFMITKHIISQLWISEGFIEEQGECSLEDTAAEYYEELVLRNLLQPEIGSSEMSRCRVNNCVRTVLGLLTKDLWTGKRRSMSSTFTQENTTLSCFRTVILHRNPSGDRVLDQVSKTIKYLRVLDLSGTGIRHIPGSLGHLLHLRLLNVSRTDIRELPSSIGSLINLQFLVLQCCYRLYSLPDGISKLRNLRTLDLEGTKPRLVLPRLAYLEQLTMLHGFILNSKPSTGKDTSGWPFEDLKSLNSLRSLQMMKIDRIQEHMGEQRVMLSRKSRLTKLELCGSARKAQEVITEEEARMQKDVLTSLRPPQCLEYLKIASFHGQSFPNWSQDLPNLQRLVIADCKFCERLPALGQLPQLKSLVVAGCSKLCAIERGQTGPTQAFPKLEQLHLEDMRHLETWEGFEASDLPSLLELRLERCPSLKSLPSCLRHSRLLRSMLIVSANSMEAIDGLGTLRELVVEDSKRLSCISNLPALEALTVVDCSGLQDVSGLELMKSLRAVDAEWTMLPDWLSRRGPIPEMLTIVGRVELLRSLVSGGKDWSAINDIGKVYGYLLDGTPFFNYSKSTAKLQVFGDRPSRIATQVAGVHRSKLWLSNAGKAMLSAAAAVLVVLLVVLLVVPLLLGYLEFVPNTVLFLFLAYITMLASVFYLYCSPYKWEIK